LEKAGIPTVQITSALPIAKMVGSNRTVLGNGIVHVVGDVKVSLEQEKEIRRQLVQRALEALRSDGNG
jgi:glycine reductase complex component B subunit gamma